MFDPRTYVFQLLNQIAISDQYAAEENPGRVLSVWQIQNSHLRDLAKQIDACLVSKIS